MPIVFFYILAFAPVYAFGNQHAVVEVTSLNRAQASFAACNAEHEAFPREVNHVSRFSFSPQPTSCAFVTTLNREQETADIRLLIPVARTSKVTENKFLNQFWYDGKRMNSFANQRITKEDLQFCYANSGYTSADATPPVISDFKLRGATQRKFDQEDFMAISYRVDGLKKAVQPGSMPVEDSLASLYLEAPKTVVAGESYEVRVFANVSQLTVAAEAYHVSPVSEKLILTQVIEVKQQASDSSSGVAEQPESNAAEESADINGASSVAEGQSQGRPSMVRLS